VLTALSEGIKVMASDVVEPVKLADVAALSGVSLATASKALNDRPNVNEETRQRVRKAAAALSYNISGLGRPRRGVLMAGVIVMMLDSHWVTPIVAGLEEAIPVDVATVLLCPPASGISGARARLDALLARGADGIVVIADSTNAISPLAESPVPVVYAYGPSSDPNDASFVPDNIQAGRIMGEHLISRGRKRIAFINGDPGFDAARDRVTGLLDALGDIGLVGGAPLYGDWSESWGRRGMRALIDSGAEVDAVVVGADRVARGVMDVLRASGKRIGKDVAVAGFDNWDELAMNAWPPLTTVDMNLTEIGRQAGAELIRRMNGETGQPGTRVLPVRLVPRESTASF
jgi:LacI family transcriptional regulator